MALFFSCPFFAVQIVLCIIRFFFFFSLFLVVIVTDNGIFWGGNTITNVVEGGLLTAYISGILAGLGEKNLKKCEGPSICFLARSCPTRPVNDFIVLISLFFFTRPWHRVQNPPIFSFLRDDVLLSFFNFSPDCKKKKGKRPCLACAV